MTRLFLVEVGSFMKKNILDLILVSLFMLVGLIIYVMNFSGNNNSDNGEKIQEGMITKDEIENANQCEKLMGDSSKIEAHCEKLSDTRCKYEECCVLLSEKSNSGDDVDSTDKSDESYMTKCVAGSKSGPTYKSDENGNQIHYDEYYYLNEKHTIKN